MGKTIWSMLRILCYNQDKVLKVPSCCLCSAVHSRDVPSEPVEAPGCDSGRDGGTGSTTMSKSDTFQGPGGFRTPSAPGRVHPHHPSPTPSQTDTSQRQERIDMRKRERDGKTKGGKYSLHNTGKEGG